MTARGQEAHGDLVLRDLTKRYGGADGFVAVDDVTLTIPQGSFFALLGPSGCGKTTTLRMIAGLEEPTTGRIELGGHDITLTRAHDRPVNTVFQSYALFPHLDVFENVAFGLRRRGVRNVDGPVREALALVELATVARRRPAQLSGGQQQRVALARAVVNRPAVLLLDEPLGALDLKLRRQMQLELKRIQTEVGLTFVHVTHDQEEAMTMADTIAVMNLGRVEQLGAPAELYDAPATTFVANFLGQSNLLRGRVVGRVGDDLLLDVQGSRVVLPAGRTRSPGPDLLVGVRPEKIRILRSGDPVGEGADALTGGTVTDTSYTGVSTQYVVRMPWGQDLGVFVQNLGGVDVLPPGTAVTLSWDARHAFGLDGRQDAAAGVEVAAADGAAASGAASGTAPHDATMTSSGR